MSSFTKSPLVLAFAAGIASPAAFAEGDFFSEIAKAVQDGSAKVDFRYRFEGVDQDRFDEDAEASTLRSRLTLKTAPYKGFTGLIEFDDVTSVGPNDYNSTENGKTEYPVVADPEGTDLNQAWLGYKNEYVDATGGRQRINHGSQRFVGGVAWRQNEQTYDGLRVKFSPLDMLDIDVSYAAQVNRIFGPDDGVQPAEWEGDNFFVRTDIKLAEGHTLSPFGYIIDVEEQGGYPAGRTVNNSTDTYGVEYKGSFDWLSVAASYATQEEGGDSELEYEADYYMVELGAKLKMLTFKAGYEVLASDNGVGFKTPLATLHKFQGWADKFLVTPGDGIEDAYASVAGKLGPVKLMAVYHDFQAEDSSADFGSEIDLIATWPVNKQLTLQAKFASFDTDDDTRYTDTDKFWLTAQLKL